METWVVVPLLLITGFVFLIIEFFLVPGFSVPGIVGLAMIGYGIFKAYHVYGATGALIAFAVSIIMTGLLIWLSLKSRAFKSMSLHYDEREAKAIDDYSVLIGKEGIAQTLLRPSGTALIEGKRIDVVTRGEYIEKDLPVTVIAVEGTRIIVTHTERS